MDALRSDALTARPKVSICLTKEFDNPVDNNSGCTVPSTPTGPSQAGAATIGSIKMLKIHAEIESAR